MTTGSKMPMVSRVNIARMREWAAPLRKRHEGFIVGRVKHFDGCLDEYEKKIGNADPTAYAYLFPEEGLSELSGMIRQAFQSLKKAAERLT